MIIGDAGGSSFASTKPSSFFSCLEICSGQLLFWLNLKKSWFCTVVNLMHLWEEQGEWAALAARPQAPSESRERLQVGVTTHSLGGWRHRHYWQRPLSNNECHGKSFKTRYNPWPPIIQVKDYNSEEKREAEVFNCSDGSSRIIEYSFIKQVPVGGNGLIDSLGAQWVHVTFQQSFSLRNLLKVFHYLFPYLAQERGKEYGTGLQLAALWSGIRACDWLLGTTALGKIPEEKGRVSSMGAPWLQERRGK